MQSQMQQSTAEHKKLHAMEGVWTSKELIHSSPWDPNGGPAKGRSQARVALDGLFVVSHYEQEKNGRVGYRGLGIYGYDPAQRKWTMQWFDNVSPSVPPPIPGTWEGDVLTFQKQAQGGHFRYVYTFVKDGEYAFRIDTSKDGAAWTTYLDAQFTRK